MSWTGGWAPSIIEDTTPSRQSEAATCSDIDGLLRAIHQELQRQTANAQHIASERARERVISEREQLTATEAQITGNIATLAIFSASIAVSLLAYSNDLIAARAGSRPTAAENAFTTMFVVSASLAVIGGLFCALASLSRSHFARPPDAEDEWQLVYALRPIEYPAFVLVILGVGTSIILLIVGILVLAWAELGRAVAIPLSLVMAAAWLFALACASAMAVQIEKGRKRLARAVRDSESHVAA